MVSPVEWKIVVDRWKKGIRPLKIQDQQHGQNMIKILEKYGGTDLAFFDCPFEAVTFLILINLMKEYEKRNYRGFNP